MSSALDAFRAQREAVEALHTRLTEVAGLLRALKEQADALAHDETLRKLLQEEQMWLERSTSSPTCGTFASVRRSASGPAVWRRWAVAAALAAVSIVAAGAGYAWATRPYETELAALRARVELLDVVAQRVLTMTPAERRQFDALMKRNSTPEDDTGQAIHPG